MGSFRPYAHSEPLAKAVELLLIKLPDADTSERSPIADLPVRVRKLLPSEVTQLIDAYQGGSPIGQLAARFSINRNTATQILRVAGVPLRSLGLNEHQIAEAEALYRLGMSLARIGARFTVDAHTVRRRLLERGVRMRGTSGQP